jgi:hypothetical protein
MEGDHRHDYSIIPSIFEWLPELEDGWQCTSKKCADQKKVVLIFAQEASNDVNDQGKCSRK